MSLDLKVDLTRLKEQEDGTIMHSGIFVRAWADGKVGNYEIEVLDKHSLLRWLKSRGGDNPWAESTVLILLGHEP